MKTDMSRMRNSAASHTAGAAKWITGAAVLVLMMGALSGCLTAETEIFVKKDGSGTVTETIMMKAEIVEMLANIRGEEDYSLLNEEELTEKAGNMGPGVEFVGAEPAARGGFTGYTATYRFDNIENLRLNQNPGDDLPDEASDSGSVEEIVRFAFEPGNTGTLTILLPGPETEESGSAAVEVPEEEQQQFIEGFQSLYNDMKISMKVTVDGNITRTNAVFREGRSITLMEIDFSKIAGDPEKVRMLAQYQPETLEGLKKLMAEVPGMKAELKEEISVTFR